MVAKIFQHSTCIEHRKAFRLGMLSPLSAAFRTKTGMVAANGKAGANDNSEASQCDGYHWETTNRSPRLRGGRTWLRTQSAWMTRVVIPNSLTAASFSSSNGCLWTISRA